MSFSRPCGATSPYSTVVWSRDRRFSPFFASAFGFDDKKDTIWATLGKVSAVNQDGTLSVMLGGSDVATKCESYCTARANDVVYVIVSKGRARAIACKGGDGNGKYLPLTGGTLTGNITISKVDAGLSLKCTDTSGRIGQTIPTGSNKRMAGEYMYDKDGRNIYYSEMIKTTADDLYRSFVVARRDAADSATKLNGFYLHINSSGESTVSFTSGGAAAWRSGLGLGTIATAASGDYLKRSPSGTTELPQDTATSSGFPIVLSDTFANGGTISYMSTANFRKLIGVDAASTNMHRSAHGNIPVVTTAPTAVNTTSWNYDKYADGQVHAWGTVRFQNFAISTQLGTGFYYNSTLQYVALPFKAAYIQSVQYSQSLGGSAGAGAYCMPGATSTSAWAQATFYLPFYVARPVAGSSGSWWFHIDVWYMAA